MSFVLIDRVTNSSEVVYLQASKPEEVTTFFSKLFAQFGIDFAANFNVVELPDFDRIYDVLFDDVLYVEPHESIDMAEVPDPVVPLVDQIAKLNDGSLAFGKVAYYDMLEMFKSAVAELTPEEVAALSEYVLTGTDGHNSSYQLIPKTGRTVGMVMPNFYETYATYR